MDDLQAYTACTTTQPDILEDGVLVRYSDLRPYVDTVIFPPELECQQWNECGRKYCHDALIDKRAGVWLDSLDGLQVYYNREQKCEGLSRVSVLWCLLVRLTFVQLL